MSQTTEKVFETYVEKILHEKAGWQRGDKTEWDKEHALFPACVRFSSTDATETLD
jgi:hypothetical protein